MLAGRPEDSIHVLVFSRSPHYAFNNRVAPGAGSAAIPRPYKELAGALLTPVRNRAISAGLADAMEPFPAVPVDDNVVRTL